ncbi:MAG: hypothetical protein DHS20C01_08460 [marine bacterium B5-7]|nr:MAG: hypothetical protein DHS20C01_08460 [marine bacterium B5-7]
MTVKAIKQQTIIRHREDQQRWSIIFCTFLDDDITTLPYYYCVVRIEFLTVGIDRAGSG